MPESETYIMPRFGGDRDWFFDRRFGLFLHWGLYALTGYHEQAQWRLPIPAERYTQLLHRFNPKHYNPEAWLDLAQEAGVEYLVFTTKHHDGFCMWPTRQTDFHVGNTPYGKDPLLPLAEACHRRGIKFGLYYSCVDWHHASYPNAGRSHELSGPKPGDRPDPEHYLDYVREQVRELCGGAYGRIDQFWWDMNPAKLQDPSHNALIRELQPGAVVNGRGFSPGDYTGTEREFDRDNSRAAYPRKIEACNSVGVWSWGYKTDEDFYSPWFLQAAIAKTLIRGGNYLLNLGPDGQGRLTPPYADRLTSIGGWLARSREAFIGVECANHLIDETSCFAARRGSTLYLVPTRPLDRTAILLKPITASPRRVTLLNDGSDLPWSHHLYLWEPEDRQHYLRVQGLPAIAGRDELPVVRVEFEEPFDAEQSSGEGQAMREQEKT